jgi:MFS family permease
MAGSVASPALDPSQSPLGSARTWAVLAMALLVMTGFGLIVPALPLFAKRFGVGEAGVGLILTAFALTRLFGDLFAGGLIDRYGERAMTALGVAIVGVSSLAAGAAQSYVELVVFRGLGGVGSALFLGGLFAYLIGTVPPASRGRAMGLFQASFGMGILIGPVLGGLLVARAGANVPLYVYGVVCLACIPLAMMVMREVHIPSNVLAAGADMAEVPAPAGSQWARLRPLLAHPTYRAALAAGLLGFVVIGAQQTLLPGYWTETLGRSEASTGIPFAVTAVFGIGVAWHAGVLSDRRGRKFTLLPALAVLCVTSIALGFATSAVAVVVVMAVLGAASGYARPGPSSMVADVAPSDARGIAVSGYRIATDIGALVGPIMVGLIAERAGFRAAWIVVGACVAAAFWMATRAHETAPALQPAR